MLHVDTQYLTLQHQQDIFPCTIGKNGPTDHKREGDGKTPLGSFPLRELYYRADRISLPAPHASLNVIPVTRNMGWCDDPDHLSYNRPVILPFEASYEMLWREDHRYDIIIPLGYNDDPPISGRGSAIFFHIMADDGSGTEGCVAVTLEDMLFLLPHLVEGMIMVVR